MDRIFRRFALFVSSKLIKFAGDKAHPEILDYLKDVVCFTQEGYSDFLYNAGEKHKELKAAVNSRAKGKHEHVANAMNALEDYCNKEIIDTAEKFASFAIKYFQIRGRTDVAQPRAIVKIFQGGQVHDIYRKGDFIAEPFPTEENQGFQTVVRDGEYYHCGNIPLQAKDDYYYNKRLIKQKVHHFWENKSWLSKQHKIFDSCPDIDWEQCWEEYSNQNDYKVRESCYKSTLIIPMTLAKAKLTPEYLNSFEKNGQHHINKKEKLLFGFFCLDHSQVQYFRELSDTKLGYILADLLSLYLLTGDNYIKNSETYEKAREIVESNTKP